MVVRPRLVVTDLDGTLIRADLSVSAYSRSVVDRARDLGVPVVAASARQPYGMADICAAAGCSPWMVCSNGAVVLHRDDRTVLHEALLGSGVQREVIDVLSRAVPGTEFVTVADGGATFRTTPGYPAMAGFRDHHRDPAQMATGPIDELTDRPVLKLIARHREVGPPELAERLAGQDDVVVTWSGTPMIEISAPGATKAVGMAVVAEHLGVDLTEVVAYGDGANDLAMLQAAGLGVGMPGGDPSLVGVVDQTAPANSEHDGMTRHLAGLLGLEERSAVTRR